MHPVHRGSSRAVTIGALSLLRMLAVIAGLLTVWLLLLVAFFSSYYGVWREPLGYALIWSAALAALGAGGAAALLRGHRIIGFAVLVPVALLIVRLSGSPI
jgi:hypothetical protein